MRLVAPDSICIRYWLEKGAEKYTDSICKVLGIVYNEG